MIWPQNAYVGQRVVTTCEWEPRAVAPNLPKPGIIYTIREIVAFKDSPLCIRLAELINPLACAPHVSSPDRVEAAFYASRFRPVDESRLDVFRKMLIKPRVSIDA